eukprot:2362871-Prymnesium_polylepis.2
MSAVRRSFLRSFVSRICGARARGACVVYGAWCGVQDLCAGSVGRGVHARRRLARAAGARHRRVTAAARPTRTLALGARMRGAAGV